MEQFDWSRFTVRININASLSSLYLAWATREGMERWFLRLSEYKNPGGVLRKNTEPVQKGDTYKWLWHGWPDETVEYGEILEANGNDYLKFSFGKAGTCTVHFKEEKATNIAELVQENIPTDEHGKQYWHVGCKTGWTFYLANLKSILEGGIDLRNKNPDLREVINS
jgi:uncharacterized protein YndB with AHSA1/START domain